MPRRTLAPAIVTLLVGAILLWRIGASGVQAYGADGAQYIEHFERLKVLALTRSGGAGLALFWEADSSFPPLLHLVTLAWGAVVGHSAGAAAALSLGWLLLLAGATAFVAGRLGGRPELAWLAILLTPGLHASATRYYYDLPMTALIWLAVALALPSRGGAPSPGSTSRGGAPSPGSTSPGLASRAGAGLAAAAAALTKWAALPFGAPLLLALGWRRGLAALALAAAVCLGFLLASGPDNSFGMMANATFAAEPSDFIQPGDGGWFGLVAGRFGERLLDAGWRGLLWYPLRAVTAVLSPLLAVAVGLVLWRGRAALRPVGRLAVAVLVGHGLFLLLVLPVWDERFLLPGVPAVALALSLAKPDRRGSLGLLAAGLLVLLDFHAGPRGPHNAEVELLDGTEHLPRTTARGLFATSSEEGRGWSRFDEDVPERAAFRVALWRAVRACGARHPTLLAERPLIDASGDHLWFQVHALERQLAGEPAVEPEVLCMPNAPRGLHALRPALDLLITSRAEGLALPPCAQPAEWEAALGVDDPEGGVGALLWVRPGSGLCGAR